MASNSVECIWFLLFLYITNKLLSVQKDQAISTMIHSNSHAMFMLLSVIHVHVYMKLLLWSKILDKSCAQKNYSF